MNTCTAVEHVSRSRGILGRGTESRTTVPTICGRPADDTGLCPRHQARAARLAAALAAKKARS